MKSVIRKLVNIRTEDSAHDGRMENSGAIAANVRPLSDRDLDAVASGLNPGRSSYAHRHRFKLQQEGRLVYLIAFYRESPIGHGQLIWDGPTGSPKDRLKDICPYVEDLWVDETFRSRGIGSQIIFEMERSALRRDYSAIGLSVGVDNHRALSLYRRLGFKTVDIGSFTLSGTVTNARGEMGFWSEECVYMNKSIQLRDGR